MREGFGKTEVFLTLVLVVVTQACVCVSKTHPAVLLWVPFTVYKWYFSEIEFSFNVKEVKGT